jgi:enolase-phosphatase E1
VHETLFPYARRALAAWLDSHGGAPEVQAILSDLRREHPGEAVNAGRDAIIRYVGSLMDQDRKSTALKALQGRIWESGYLSGEVVAPVYDDVPRALRRWQQAAVGAGIFSSGSVLAQQLLFRHSSAGDLTPLLRWHFDTTIGAKIDAESYERIASAIGAAPSAIAFVSDAVRELDAARTAGLQTVLCRRPGNPEPPAGHGHASIASFDELPDALPDD